MELAVEDDSDVGTDTARLAVRQRAWESYLFV